MGVLLRSLGFIVLVVSGFVVVFGSIEGLWMEDAIILFVVSVALLLHIYIGH